MNPTQNRLEIFVDVFDEKNQRAWPLPTIKPPELIAAILQEFRGPDKAYLVDDPAAYDLVRSANNALLVTDKPLDAQLEKGEHLSLLERLPETPPGARPPRRRLYLRELSSNQVFRISWVPAIIGRPDPARTDNKLLAVNLRNTETGLRVSRRQAKIIENNDTFFIQSLSPNPTSVRQVNHSSSIPVNSEPIPLAHGDSIILERSNITLQIIIRDEMADSFPEADGDDTAEVQSPPTQEDELEASQ